jgi:polyhydroxyalkanoate synthase
VTVPSHRSLPHLSTPIDLAARVGREIERNALRARNGIKLAAGVSRPGVGLTPKEVVWQRGRAQLWRYRNDEIKWSPPLLFVASLVNRSYILDLLPGNSFIEQLRDAGFDVFMLDWGVADERDAGNTLEDYVDGYLPAALERACEVSHARHLNVVGYCGGGALLLLSAAHHPALPVRSLATIATPVDFSQMPFTDLSHIDLSLVVDETGNVPAGVIRQAFRILMPTADAVQYADLLENLWNDAYLVVYQAMTRWINDHVPFPGATARQMGEMLVRENGMVAGTVRLGGDRVTLADIRYPLLNVMAKRDNIVPLAAARPILGLVGSTDKEELLLDAGHIGLVVGRKAAKVTVPQIIDFLQRRSEPTEPKEPHAG